jgi:Family of unknown function (DUF5678)
MNDELLQQVKKYEGKWVALFGSDEEMEIVAIGEDAAEVSEHAAEKGYTETILLRVLPPDISNIPFA